ncbi:RNA polymerase sigma factor [Lacunimicrobium album]
MSEVRQLVETLYVRESRRVFASLVRLLGDFDSAEEAMHEAFAAAVEKWETEGVPANPRAWLVSAGRFKRIDAIRRSARFDSSKADILRRQDGLQPDEKELDVGRLEDDTLRLIFTCCHPSLNESTQVALTLREVCGLTTEEVARAFLTTPPTIAQRIVRGKSKIRSANIPYEIPSVDELPERIEAVLSVIYLVFNEGYSASSGDAVTRSDLTGEAIRLGRVLMELLDDSEVAGLTALMLLHDSRKAARVDMDGELILLEDQDRSLWHRDAIQEGRQLVAKAMSSGSIGLYTIQAAISLAHAEAENSSSTNWERIVSLYDLLLTAGENPVIELNRAVALAMRDGPEVGLAVINTILADGHLKDYHLAHAAKADLLRRLGQNVEAKTSYLQALELAQLEPEKRFLRRRLQEVS